MQGFRCVHRLQRLDNVGHVSCETIYGVFMYEERLRKVAIKMGCQKIKPLITCTPGETSAVKDYSEVTESKSLSYVYTLLEEWGLWAAATETVQGVGSVREKAGFVIDDETALFIDGLILTLRKKDGFTNYDVVVLIYIYRLSYRETSKRLGLNSAAVKPAIDRYAYWLDGKLSTAKKQMQENIDKVLTLRLNKR